jgi:hypothetical protein
MVTAALVGAALLAGAGTTLLLDALWRPATTLTSLSDFDRSIKTPWRTRCNLGSVVRG